MVVWGLIGIGSNIESGKQQPSPSERQPTSKLDDLQAGSAGIKEKVDKREPYPDYTIKASLDEESARIQGKLELTVENPGTDQLLFYAYPYDWAPMDIHEVQLNGQEIGFEFDGKNLTVNNEKEKRTLDVWIEFETPVPRTGTRFGVKDNVWLITTWYPMLGVLDEDGQWIERPNPINMGDPFYFNFANYTVEWTAPSDFKWVSSGSLESETADEEQNTAVWKVDRVRNFALVGSPNYLIRTFPLNDQTTISIALTDEANFKKVEEIAQNTYPLFTEIYGKLPYADVAIAETSYGTNYALEYPNLAIFSKDMYAQDKIEHWIPHEVGHTWWYNAVGVNETDNGWFDEGLAEQGVVWYLEKRYSKSRGQKLWDEYRAEHRALIENYPGQSMDAGLYGFSNYKEFDYAWYSRAADMFLTVRRALGDEKYVQFLNTLYEHNISKVGDEKSLNEALKQSLGLKTDFFSDWLHEPYTDTEWEVQFEEIQ